jgi:two-component system chemotaxis sensor kinase CheA
MRNDPNAPREAPTSQVWLTIGLVVLVLLFTGALFGTVLVNAAITVHTQSNLKLVNVAARQSDLVERVTKDLLQLQLALRNNQPTRAIIADLSDAGILFETSFKAFQSGGRTTDLAGTPIIVPALRTDQQTTAQAQVQAIWSPLHDKIAALIASPTPSPALVDDAAAYALVAEARLSNLTSNIALSVERTAAQSAQDLTFIRNLLIGLAVLCVVLIVAILFARVSESQAQIQVYASTLELRAEELAESTRALAEAKQGADLIMSTVHQGLFLIGPDHRIESQYSRDCEEIFRMKDLAGYNFLNILQRILTERMFNTSRDYVGLLFDPKKKERAVLKVNPLDEVEVNFPHPEGGFISKYLAFSFRRIVEDGQITRVFIAVNDVTDRMLLEQRLRVSEHKKERQFELLLGILHVEPRLLDEFIAGAQARTKEINDALRAQDFAGASSGQMDMLRGRLDVVFRCVHNIKGNAAALSLEYFQKTCESFEQKIVELRSRPSLGGDDFLAIVIAESELRADLDELQDLREKLSGIQRAHGGPITATVAGARAEAAPQSRDDVVDTVKALAQSLALKLAKDVRVDADGFDTRGLPPELRRSVKDVLIQLARNSLAHGIESPGMREASGKPKRALIEIKPLPALPAGSFGFIFRDDGNGLDPVAIGERAVELGLLSREEAARSDESQVARLIFAPGFTTANGSTTDAGRGIGMDVVKHIIVDECGGEIGVRSDPGRYCQFTFVLPLLRGAPVTTGTPA